MQDFKKWFDNTWIKDVKNQCKSFTWGCALYDYIDEGYNVPDNVEEALIELAARTVGASEPEKINVRAAVEILDISDLDDIVEQYMSDDDEDEGEDVED